MFRLFTGIGLPPDVREQLALLQEDLIGEGVRLIPPEDFHITLSFIGNVDAAAAEAVDEALSGIRIGRFSLTVKGAGYFSGNHGPNHIWMGIERSDPLQRLKDKIDRALEKHEVPFEKRSRYTPHITVARLKQADEGLAGSFLQQHNLFRSAPFTVGAFILYRSRGEKEEGPRYEEMKVYPLLP